MNAWLIFFGGVVAGVGLAALARMDLWKFSRPRRSLADRTDEARIGMRLVWTENSRVDGRAGDVENGSDFI